MKKKTITVDWSFEVTALHFAEKKVDNYIYIVLAEDFMKDVTAKINHGMRLSVESDYKKDFAMASAFISEDGERFFHVCSADCFAPPFAIIRAEDESDAYSLFLTKTSWCKVTDKCELDELLHGADDLPNGYDFNDDCELVHTENVQLREVVLVGIEL